MVEHWVPISLLGVPATFQCAARQYAEQYAAIAVQHERERCIATLRALKDDSGVNDDGQAWLRRLTRGDCIQALVDLPHAV